MKYTIYKITNTINNKFYIGKHQTNNVNDSYMGSGTAIKDAIKKYGKENFIKEILFVFDNEQDMNKKEKELITEELVSNPNCYNVGIGGEGGPHFKGRTHTDETKEKISKSSKLSNRDYTNARNGIKRFHDNIKQSDPDFYKRRAIKLTNRKLSDETKKKISNKLKLYNENLSCEEKEQINMKKKIARNKRKISEEQKLKARESMLKYWQQKKNNIS